MSKDVVVSHYYAGAKPSPMDAVRGVLGHRDLLFGFTRRNVLMSSRGSILGIGWIIVMPLMMMLLYSFVFGFVFGGRYGALPDETGIEYALGIFLSLSIFQLFAEPMASAPTLISSSPTLVKKVVFPLEILPTSEVAAQSVRFIVSLTLVAAGTVFLGRGVQATWVWLPLLAVPILLLSLGTALLFSAIGVFLRDLAELTRVLSTVFLFGSGVFFSMDRLPTVAKYVLGVNPLLHILEQTRGIMLWGHSPHWPAIIYATVASAIVFILGLVCFQHLRGDFADVI